MIPRAVHPQSLFRWLILSFANHPGIKISMSDQHRLQDERWKCPEALFNPSLVGLETWIELWNFCAISTWSKNELFNNIVHLIDIDAADHFSRNVSLSFLHLYFVYWLLVWVLKPPYFPPNAGAFSVGSTCPTRKPWGLLVWFGTVRREGFSGCWLDDETKQHFFRQSSNQMVEFPLFDFQSFLNLKLLWLNNPPQKMRNCWFRSCSFCRRNPSSAMQKESWNIFRRGVLWAVESGVCPTIRSLWPCEKNGGHCSASLQRDMCPLEVQCHARYQQMWSGHPEDPDAKRGPFGRRLTGKTNVLEKGSPHGCSGFDCGDWVIAVTKDWMNKDIELWSCLLMYKWRNIYIYTYTYLLI